ncbi:hypothetical protein D9628_14150, partial [Staphylococcus aureus]
GIFAIIIFVFFTISILGGGGGGGGGSGGVEGGECWGGGWGRAGGRRGGKEWWAYCKCRCAPDL